MRIFQSIIFSVIIFFAIPFYLFPQDKSGSINLFTPENRLKFGNYLFCQGDFLRSIDEFKAYLDNNKNDTIKFKIAFGYYQMSKYKIAEIEFGRLAGNGDLRDESRLGVFQSIFFSGNYKLLREKYIGNEGPPEKYINEVKRLYFLSFLFDNAEMPDSSEFLNAFDLRCRNDLRKFYNQKINPGYKNQTAAMLLSVIIPGLGKIYTEDYGNGITAFLGVGLLAFLAYDNFKADHDFRAWLFTGLTAIFYAGNIYGSAASAQLYNAGIKFNFDNEVKLYFEKRNYLLPTRF